MKIASYRIEPHGDPTCIHDWNRTLMTLWASIGGSRHEAMMQRMDRLPLLFPRGFLARHVWDYPNPLRNTQMVILFPYEEMNFNLFGSDYPTERALRATYIDRFVQL